MSFLRPQIDTCKTGGPWTTAIFSVSPASKNTAKCLFTRYASGRREACWSNLFWGQIIIVTGKTHWQSSMPRQDSFLNDFLWVSSFIHFWKYSCWVAFWIPSWEQSESLLPPHIFPVLTPFRHPKMLPHQGPQIYTLLNWTLWLHEYNIFLEFNVPLLKFSPKSVQCEACQFTLQIYIRLLTNKSAPTFLVKFFLRDGWMDKDGIPPVWNPW
jgi:hypothetical protein